MTRDELLQAAAMRADGDRQWLPALPRRASPAGLQRNGGTAVAAVTYPAQSRRPSLRRGCACAGRRWCGSSRRAVSTSWRQCGVKPSPRVQGGLGDWAKSPTSITVFFDGKTYWLGDGFHRVAAAKKAGLDEVEFDVRRGGAMTVHRPVQAHGPSSSAP